MAIILSVLADINLKRALNFNGNWNFKHIGT
jgi:hypothetical protein